MNCFKKKNFLGHQVSWADCFFVIVITQFSFLIFAENLPSGWQHDFSKAKAIAVKQKKPILAFISASWCPPCQVMIKNVYPQAKVIKALDKMVPVYIDYDKQPDLGDRFEVKFFPTFIILDPQEKELGRFTGGYDADGFLKAIGDILNLNKDALLPAQPLTGLKWMKGAAVKMKKGSVYVVEFWATWCKPCLQTMPHLSAIQKKYKDKNVTVIGVSNERAAVVAPFVEKQGEKMGYSIAVDFKGDVHNGYMTAYKQQGIPTAFIIDQAQQVVWFGHPLQEMDEVLSLVVAGSFNKAEYEKQKAHAADQKQITFVKLNKYIEVLSTSDDKDQIKLLGKELIGLNADPQLFNQLVWYVLNQIEIEKIDYPVMMTIAKKVCDLTEMNNVEYLNTYALALFKSGKVNDAIKIQTMAIKLVNGNAQLTTYLQTILDEYKGALK